MVAGEWDRPYPRSAAVYPVPALRGRGYLSPVRRIDQAYGDRNLVCACPPPEAFEDAPAPDDLGTVLDVVGGPQA
jgi:glycine dehydrogenase